MKPSVGRAKFRTVALLLGLVMALGAAGCAHRSRAIHVCGGGGYYDEEVPAVELEIERSLPEMAMTPVPRLALFVGWYPWEMKRAGVIGFVSIRAEIGADGAVAHFAIVDATHPSFAEAVERRFSSIRFFPALQAGVAVAAHVDATFWFTLKEPG
jgi:hypothetical protein